MSVRGDIEDLMATEVQRFREEPLGEKEIENIKNDVTAFCIIEIQKYCGEDVFERKAKELEDKGIRKARPHGEINSKI